MGQSCDEMKEELRKEFRILQEAECVKVVNAFKAEMKREYFLVSRQAAALVAVALAGLGATSVYSAYWAAKSAADSGAAHVATLQCQKDQASADAATAGIQNEYEKLTAGEELNVAAIHARRILVDDKALGSGQAGITVSSHDKGNVYIDDQHVPVENNLRTSTGRPGISIDEPGYDLKVFDSDGLQVCDSHVGRLLSIVKRFDGNGTSIIGGRDRRLQMEPNGDLVVYESAEETGTGSTFIPYKTHLPAPP